MAGDTSLRYISNEMKLIDKNSKFKDDDYDYPVNKEKFPHIERCDLAKCQILGNIFDNPDLLNDINE